jgi:hypothetical protein
MKRFVESVMDLEEDKPRKDEKDAEKDAEGEKGDTEVEGPGPRWQ